MNTSLPPGTMTRLEPKRTSAPRCAVATVPRAYGYSPSRSTSASGSLEAEGLGEGDTGGAGDADAPAEGEGDGDCADAGDDGGEDGATVTDEGVRTAPFTANDAGVGSIATSVPSCVERSTPSAAPAPTGADECADTIVTSPMAR